MKVLCIWRIQGQPQYHSLKYAVWGCTVHRSEYYKSVNEAVLNVCSVDGLRSVMKQLSWVGTNLNSHVSILRGGSRIHVYLQVIWRLTKAWQRHKSRHSQELLLKNLQDRWHWIPKQISSQEEDHMHAGADHSQVIGELVERDELWFSKLRFDFRYDVMTYWRL